MSNINKYFLFTGIAVLAFVYAVSPFGYNYFISFQNREADEEAVRLGIEIRSPAKMEQILSPVKISGRARGIWYFEGSFPVFITDEAGGDLGQGIARIPAGENWMTTDYVYFSAEIPFARPTYSKTGYLVFRHDNPSGRPEGDIYYKYSINFK